MMDLLRGKVTRQDWIFVGVVALATIVLFVGFYFLLYTRIQNNIATRQAQLRVVQSRLNEARTIDENIEDLREEAREMNQLVEIFEKRLPEDREIPLLLSRFERLGGQIGLRVRLSSLPTYSLGHSEVIPYRVTAYGQFHQIVNFINLLERDERYLKITELNIGEEDAGVSQATFVLSTFSFKVKADTRQ